MTSPDWSRWPAPAKLNLFLRLVGRRDDGYHCLQTVFQLLDWGDEIALRVRDDGRVIRHAGAAGVAPEHDLVVRAASLLKEHADGRLGVDIEVDKRVPMGGGLGGGSSDAATVLVALNRLWGLNLGVDMLAALGVRLGADVPVFVRGHSAWAEGVGEQLTPLKLPSASYVIVDPGVAVSTSALFQAPELTRNAPEATISGFLAGEVRDNAFEPVVRARYPRVAAALDWLGEFGVARLSGTGCCVFLGCSAWAEADAIAARCPPEFRAVAATGVDESPLLAAVAKIA